MKEVWKDVLGYEGLYEVSNHGNVRSLDRVSWNGHGLHEVKGRVLKGSESKGYLNIALCSNGVVENTSIHRLVACNFISPPPFKNAQVDHIDGNKKNNKPNNLRWCTSRENQHFYREKHKTHSVGVHWHKKQQKWTAVIYMGGKNRTIGTFDSYNEADKAFNDVLTNGINSISKYKRSLGSVHFRRDSKKWRSYINIKNKRINIGTFETKNKALDELEYFKNALIAW